MKNMLRLTFHMLLSVLWHVAISENDCESVCKCVRVTDDLYMDCSLQDLKFVNGIDIQTASSVNFSHNSIEILQTDFVSLPNLKLLDLSHNNIHEFPENIFSKLTNLQILNLTNNMISALPKNLPEKLKLLLLSHNRIKTFDLSALNHLVNLQALYLEFNSISAVSSGNLDSTFNPSLKMLHTVTFRGNQLESFPIYLGIFLQNVKKLSLCNNSLTSVLNNTFTRLLQVNYLDLSWNKLESIQSNSFSKNVYLKYLFLSNNFLGNFPSGLPMLEWLDISFNTITKISESSQSSDLYPQEMFLIGGNPFHCDCELLWLKEFYDTRKYLKSYIQVDMVKFIPICASPSEIFNNSWDALENSAFICSENEEVKKTDFDVNDHHSWKIDNVFVEIKEVLDTHIRMEWSSDAVKSETLQAIIMISIHPFGKKHLRQRTMSEISLGKYIIKNLTGNTPYIICVSIVPVNNHDVSQTNMVDLMDNCHEIVTMETVINRSFVHSIIFYIFVFLCSVVVYYFSVWVCFLKQVYNLVQFIRLDSNEEVQKQTNNFDKTEDKITGVNG